MKRILPAILILAMATSGQNPNTPKFPGAAATDADLFVATNFGSTTLNGSITSGSTSIILTSATGFVAPVVALLGAEIIHCPALVSNTLTCVRGQEGTSAASHTNGSSVLNIVTAWHHNQIAAEEKSLETWAVSNAGGYGSSGGAANAQTVTLAPAITSLTTGLTVCWTPSANNTTTTPTLAVNGLTATTIVKAGGAALAAADLTTTAIACAKYDGSKFELQNPQTTSSGGGASIMSGSYSGLPGTCNPGDLYLASPYQFKCATSPANTWVPYYRGFPTTLPPSSVTWVQQNSSTYSQTNGYGTISVINWNGNYTMAELITTVPATPYKYYARVSYNAFNGNFMNHGLCLYESSTSKALVSGISSSGNLRFFAWSSSSAIGVFTDVALFTYSSPQDLVWEVGDDGTNVTSGYSTDGGVNFIPVLSATRATYFTSAPNKVGFCFEKNNTSFTNDFVTIWGFEQH